ncbi:hypothetical protein OVA29_10830 [Exiguobacterium sp. SL14]|nr:hypothetical protein [Exiguobacterium sp. SL14]MCY1691109.1 hypothetical protein [Exiguobacterium sp. SL14]
MILWWMFLASLLPVPFYLALVFPALAFVPHRSLRIGLQLLAADWGIIFPLSPSKRLSFRLRRVVCVSRYSRLYLALCSRVR